MSVESDRSAEPRDDIVDLGGGCDGNCAGCGTPGAADAADAARPKAPVPPEIRLARLTFLLGALVGLGVAALVGIVWPAALPVIAAVTLGVVAVAGVLAVTSRRSATRG